MHLFVVNYYKRYAFFENREVVCNHINTWRSIWPKAVHLLASTSETNLSLLAGSFKPIVRITITLTTFKTIFRAVLKTSVSFCKYCRSTRNKSRGEKKTFYYSIFTKSYVRFCTKEQKKMLWKVLLFSIEWSVVFGYFSYEFKSHACKQSFEKYCNSFFFRNQSMFECWRTNFFFRKFLSLNYFMSLCLTKVSIIA